MFVMLVRVKSGEKKIWENNQNLESIWIQNRIIATIFKFMVIMTKNWRKILIHPYNVVFPEKLKLKWEGRGVCLPPSMSFLRRQSKVTSTQSTLSQLKHGVHHDPSLFLIIFLFYIPTHNCRLVLNPHKSFDLDMKSTLSFGLNFLLYSASSDFRLQHRSPWVQALAPW